jgi:hypothetical protein
MEVIALIIAAWALCGLWAVSLVMAGGKEDAFRRRAIAELAAERIRREAP